MFSVVSKLDSCFRQPFTRHVVGRGGTLTIIGMLAVCVSFSTMQAQQPQRDEKASRTAAQKKLDSHIVLAIKKSRGEPPFDKPTQLDPDLAIEPDGRVLVDLNAKVTAELLALIERRGGKVLQHFESMRFIRARVPLSSLEGIAAHSDVSFISPAAQATTNNSGGAAQSSSIKP